MSVQTRLPASRLISLDNPPNPTTFECQENPYDIKSYVGSSPWIEPMTSLAFYQGYNSYLRLDQPIP